MPNIFVFIYYVMKRIECYKVISPCIRQILIIYCLYLAYTWSYHKNNPEKIRNCEFNSIAALLVTTYNHHNVLFTLRTRQRKNTCVNMQ